MFLRSYILLGVIALLAFVSISIVLRLFTANYPTHSDVFFSARGKVIAEREGFLLSSVHLWYRSLRT